MLFSQNPDDTLSTNMFIYGKWPREGAPQSPSDIIQLLSTMEASQTEDSERPVLVVCRYINNHCKT